MRRTCRCAQFEDQLAALTDAIEEAVGERPVSYRSGRFGFPPRTSPRSRSSVTRWNRASRHSSTRRTRTVRTSSRRRCGRTILAYDSATKPGTSGVLEVPVLGCVEPATAQRRCSSSTRARRSNYTTKRILRKLGVAHVRWLRPSYSSLDDMIGLARDLAEAGEPVLNLLFHSSEAIVGGSPYNRTDAELAAFCDRLERFFDYAVGTLKAPASDVLGVPWRVRPRTSDLGPRTSTLRIVHVTPHLPPDQAANALLPFQLGEWARARGDCGALHRPSARPRAATMRPDVTWMPRTRRTLAQRMLRTGSITGAWRIRQATRAILSSADIVHVHSNGLLAEVAAAFATSLAKPVVLTLYGTEIWHYTKKAGVDLFTRAYRRADAVTFYSQRLLDKARGAGARTIADDGDLSAGRGLVPLSRSRRRNGGGAQRSRYDATRICSST